MEKRKIKTLEEQTYDFLRKLKEDTKEKLGKVERDIRITDRNLEKELKIRQKILMLRRKIQVREKFYKKKLYIVNKRINHLIFEKKQSVTINLKKKSTDWKNYKIPKQMDQSTKEFKKLTSSKETQH